MTKKKATQPDTTKAIGVLLADAARTKQALESLKAEVAALAIQVRAMSQEPPRRRLLQRLLGR